MTIVTRRGHCRSFIKTVRTEAALYSRTAPQVPGQKGRSLMEKPVLLTPEGREKIEKELDELRTVRRDEIAERIKYAKDFGDISENAEYEDAKNEQGMLEGRILVLENMLRNAVIIDSTGAPGGVVGIGSV